MERSGNFYKAIRLGYILISILIGCMAYNSLYEWQEIAGKVWKKEDELKQLKSELAALDRKIQLELAPPTPEVTEKEKDGQEVKPDAEGVRNVPSQHTEEAPQIRSPANDRSPSGNFIADHIVIGRPGISFRDENKPKGLKM